MKIETNHKQEYHIPFIKNILIGINTIRFIPHILCYLFFSSRVREDIKANLDFRGISCPIIWGLLYLLVFDNTFRTLYYWRLGEGSICFSISCPPSVFYYSNRFKNWWRGSVCTSFFYNY